jgi:hypothetical protein
VFDEAGEDELLLAAMMELGAKGGAIGGAIGGAVNGLGGLGRAGARGGARGAARGFKRMKKDVSTALVSLPGTAREASQLVCDALAGAGNLVGTQTREDGAIAVRAVIGIGIGGLNPAVVTAVVAAAPDAGATVELRAAGREGLIKQHPADKALAKITALLKGASR